MLLLVLLLRAAVPAGYMPVVGPRGVQIAMCGSGSPAGILRDATRGHRQAHAEGLCPFALSAANGPPPSSIGVHPLVIPMRDDASGFSNRLAATDIPRYAAPRGPPQPARA